MSSMLAAGSPAGATPSIRKPDLSDLGRDGPTVGLVAIALGSNSGTIACAIASYILKTRVDSRGSDIGGFLENEPGHWQVMVAELPRREDPSIKQSSRVRCCLAVADHGASRDGHGGSSGV